MTDDKTASGVGPRSVPQGHKYLFFTALGAAFILLAFLFNTPAQILAGSLTILSSPANLLTDYFQLANIGATLFNVGIMTLMSLLTVYLSRADLSGSVVAAIFTMAGFSFFGKNLYNSLPILLGVFLYVKAVRVPFRQFIAQGLFATALGPLVSEFSFNLGLPLLSGVAMGITAGLLAGFVIPPLSAQFLSFHHGHDLYNTGFTAGIIGMIVMAVLRGFGVKIETVSLLSSGHNPAFAALLCGLSLVLLLCGFVLNVRSIRGLGGLFKLSGVLPTDFMAVCGVGPTLLNMGLLGVLATTYVLAVGGELNGPVIGGILTVIGFGAHGKHLKNVVPVMLGVFLMSLFNIHGVRSTSAIIAALFSTALAPIAGKYGAAAGILAGMLHVSLVSNVSFLHAGMNLYNNGFSAGFIAAVLHPLLNAFIYIRAERKKPRGGGTPTV